MNAPNTRESIATLIQKFQSDPARHTRNEQETRLYYILPLFDALGWNTQDPNDMSAEEQISNGRVDFGFYLQGVPQFYLETKRANKKLDDPKSIRQSINYAYLKGVTWAVLTDFERLMVFNADFDEPDPLKTRLLDLHLLTDPLDKLLEDLWLLSKPAMQARPRKIDDLAERYGKKARREPVTELLFNSLATWRAELFNEITQQSETLWTQDKQTVDNAIQKFFDRLIFLRTLEDRNVEGSLLKELRRQHPNTLFKRLLEEFRTLDAIYNSNLFAPHRIDDLQVYDPVLVQNIVDGLYTTLSGNSAIDYDFSVISADLLGTIYEQYLSHKATDPTPQNKRKPKTNKSAKRGNKRNNQGIFYTPQYVVRYIVQSALMPVLQATPDPHNITILDPACGSGAFLIEAFDVLDRYFATLDERDNPTATPAEREQRQRDRRERILKHNLYGVDLDEQAVEVTRLNLVLRAAYQRQKLPMLTHIRQGNSLATDTLDHAFNWEREFAATHARGGFDVIIGNPPYVRQEYLPAEFKDYAAAHYTAATASADLYVYFVERGFSLLREGGRLGFILPNKWLRAKYGEPLREYLQDKIQHLVDFGDLPVFPDATTYPLIMTLQHGATDTPPTHTHAHSLPTHAADLLENHLAPAHTLSRAGLTRKRWELNPPDGANLLVKLRAAGTPLGEYVSGKIYRGVTTGFNAAFVIDAQKRRELIAQDARSAEIIKPFLAGRDVKRYAPPHTHKWIIFTRRGVNIDDYPAIREHLEQYRAQLTPKPADHQGAWSGRKGGDYAWYEIQDTTAYYEAFEQPKIIFPDISTVGNFTLDTQMQYADATSFVMSADSLYLLAILNARTTNYFISQISSQIRGGFLRWKKLYVEQIPVPNIPPTDARYTQLVALVHTRLQRAAELAALETGAGLNAERAAELRHIQEELDAQIDALVYALYGLTDGEIALVEGV